MNLVDRAKRRAAQVATTRSLSQGLRVPVSAPAWKPTWRTELLGDLLRHRTGVLLDVGANAGQTLMDYLHLDVQPGYVGFEPLPEAAAVTQRIIDINSLPNAILVPAALAQHHGVQVIRIPDGDDTSATLVEGLRPGRRDRSLVVSTHPLDDIWPAMSNGRSVGVVKIDVEGAELAALTGMRRMLASDRPPVLCEVLDRDERADPRAHDARLARLEALLSEVGYGIERVDKPQGTFAGLTPVAGFPRQVWRSETAEACDYLLRPSHP